MKISKLLLIALFAVTTAGIVTAQDTPDVPDAPVLREDEIRNRSIDLERVRRDSRSKSEPGKVTMTDDLEEKYPQIKEDFEGMQIQQGMIVRAYTTGDTPDYAVISESAGKIEKHAKRLDTNLFASVPKEEKKKEKEEAEKSVRDLIIELDAAIGELVGSEMFLNLRVVDPDVAFKTHTHVLRVRDLSAALSAKAAKMNEQK